MKLRFILAVAALLGGAGANAVAQTSIADTRDNLSKWVEARKTLGRVQADWSANRETLKASISLFEGELKRLQEQLKAIEEGEGENRGNQQIAKEIEEQSAGNEELKAAMEKVTGLLTAFEERFRAIHKRLPPPLVRKIKDVYAMVPENPAETKLTVGKRLQALIGMIKAIDEFNSSIQVEPETRAIGGGGEIAVRTIYLGLGQAFYTDKNGNYAGTGTATAAGWEWTEDKALAPVIARTLAIYDSVQPAAYVGLPIKVN